MHIMKKLMLLVSIFLALGLGFLFYMSEEETKNSHDILRIGAGDDVTGLLLEEIMAEDKDIIDLASLDENGDLLDGFAFKDC